jgi:hypothetical protein
VLLAPALFKSSSIIIISPLSRPERLQLPLGDLGLDLHVQWMPILSTAAPTHAGMCVKSSFGRTKQL